MKNLTLSLLQNLFTSNQPVSGVGQSGTLPPGSRLRSRHRQVENCRWHRGNNEGIDQACLCLHPGTQSPHRHPQTIDTTDFHVEAIDLLVNHIPSDAGIALVVALYSAIKKHSTLPALLILGDLSIQGNIKAVRSLAEPLQVGMDNGARRTLIPIENKRHFLDVSADIMERVDPIFYGDPVTAAMKALGIN